MHRVGTRLLGRRSRKSSRALQQRLLANRVATGWGREVQVTTWSAYLSLGVPRKTGPFHHTSGKNMAAFLGNTEPP